MATNNVVNSYVYDSFGNIMQKTEGVVNNYTYTAREYDSESGLYYYRARYYDAKVGRFVQEDPRNGGIIEPASQNRYIYSLNNPVIYIDSTGLKVRELTKEEQKSLATAVQVVKDYLGDTTRLPDLNKVTFLVDTSIPKDKMGKTIGISTNTIYLSPEVLSQGGYLLVETVAHELVHIRQKTSPISAVAYAILFPIAEIEASLFGEALADAYFQVEKAKTRKEIEELRKKWKERKKCKTE
jgi:RHS repeat-associated protein